jgi:hypothetical protein
MTAQQCLSGNKLFSNLSKVLFALCFIFTFSQVAAQELDKGKSLFQIQKELAPIAFDLLNDSSNIETKFAVNKLFGARLMSALGRKGSFDFPFDSLKTVSILKPADGSFRIFTWYLFDNQNEHFHYGVVQRRIVRGKNDTLFVVIPLMDLAERKRSTENVQLNNREWLGALYYKLESYKTTDNFRDEKTGKQYKDDVTYYTLLGWNGVDASRNIKLIDILAFDKKDSTRVLFGVPIIYFGQIPKYRVVFEYADNSPFNLNIRTLENKKQAIVFDHLSQPNKVKKTEAWDYGADGSYDAIRFIPRNGGFFVWQKDVKVLDDHIDSYKKEDILLRRSSDKKEHLVKPGTPGSK